MLKSSSLRFPLKFFIAQTGWILFLVVSHLITQLRNVFTGRSVEAVQGSMQLLNLDNEANLPAWYSSCALFSCALLLAAIAALPNSRRRDRTSWLGLSLMFMYLSLDEAISIHERFLPGLLRQIDSLSFISQSYDWTVLGGIAVVAVGIIFFRFWQRLPFATRWLFAAAAAVFVGGAIGFEKISHFYEALYQTENSVAYVVTVAIEEGLEMMGVAIFIYALLQYLYINTQRYVDFSKHPA